MNTLIEERKKTHGDFNEKAHFIQQVKTTIRQRTSEGVLTAYQAEALDNIAQKMGRILFGDSTHEDHWDDIAGYSQLGKGK